MSRGLNPRWTAALAVTLFISACGGAADSASTAAPTQPSSTAPGAADQSARIGELEQEVAALTEDLAAVRDDLAQALADLGSYEDQVARLTGRAADLEASFGSWQDYVNSWAQPYFDQLRLELELLRPLIPLADSPEARQSLEALQAFLAATHGGDYATAAALYGGDYEFMVDWNPLVDSADEAALFEAACTYQLRCELAVRRILAGPIQPGTYTFYVEFQTDDGQLWSMGPCCGDTEGLTVFQFPFVVSWTEDGPRILTPPIYTP